MLNREQYRPSELIETAHQLKYVPVSEKVGTVAVQKAIQAPTSPEPIHDRNWDDEAFSLADSQH